MWKYIFGTWCFGCYYPKLLLIIADLHVLGKFNQKNRPRYVTPLPSLNVTIWPINHFHSSEMVFTLWKLPWKTLFTWSSLNVALWISPLVSLLKNVIVLLEAEKRERWFQMAPIHYREKSRNTHGNRHREWATGDIALTSKHLWTTKHLGN